MRQYIDLLYYVAADREFIDWRYRVDLVYTATDNKYLFVFISSHCNRLGAAAVFLCYNGNIVIILLSRYTI